MTIALALITFGGLLLYAGWSGRSLTALLRGDNSHRPAGAPPGLQGPVR